MRPAGHMAQQSSFWSSGYCPTLGTFFFAVFGSFATQLQGNSAVASQGFLDMP